MAQNFMQQVQQIFGRLTQKQRLVIGGRCAAHAGSPRFSGEELQHA